MAELTERVAALTLGEVPQKQPASDCGTIKVLSWNINGKSGLSEIRNKVVPKNVGKIDPDVLLLQEKKIRDMVNKKTGAVNSFTNRKYISVESAKDGESRVIYDSEKYQLIPKEEKVFGGKSLEEVFDESIQVFPSHDGSTTRSATNQQAEIGRIPHPLEEVVKGRTSYICLETKGSDPVRRIVFMSFHNMYINKDKGDVIHCVEAAIGFCKMMKIMQKQLTGVTVVAGADLNRTKNEISENVSEASREEVMEVLVPYDPVQYDITRRKRTIDHILASPTTDCATNVRALDFVRAKDKSENPLHEVMSKLKHTTRDLNEALDHDPIICDILISPKPTCPPPEPGQPDKDPSPKLLQPEKPAPYPTAPDP